MLTAGDSNQELSITAIVGRAQVPTVLGGKVVRIAGSSGVTEVPIVSCCNLLHLRELILRTHCLPLRLNVVLDKLRNGILLLPMTLLGELDLALGTPATLGLTAHKVIFALEPWFGHGEVELWLGELNAAGAATAMRSTDRCITLVENTGRVVGRALGKARRARWGGVAVWVVEAVAAL